MENSDETEVNQTFHSPPLRRRSTFFERRDSIVAAPQPMFESAETFTKKDTESEKRVCDMSLYYDKLLSEKDQWKRETNERRNKYRDIRQQYQMATKAPARSRMSYTALSNEDIEYLKAKPNLTKLVESQQKLHMSTKQAVALMRKVIELDEVIVGYCEDKVNQITQHILENSTINSVN